MIIALVLDSVGFAVIVVDVTGECVKGRAAVFEEIIADMMLDTFVETL